MSVGLEKYNEALDFLCIRVPGDTDSLTLSDDSYLAGHVLLLHRLGEDFHPRLLLSTLPNQNISLHQLLCLSLDWYNDSGLSHYGVTP